MARGQIAKAEIAKKILNNFEGAFEYNNGKEIRIPTMENGELIQIKVALTTAKENVQQGDENLLPGEVETKEEKIDFEEKKTTNVEPTKKELENVSDLLRALGL